MSQITITVPPAFVPVLDELVNATQSGTREQWLVNVARGVLIDYQTRKDFAAQYDARLRQLHGFWPAPTPVASPPFPTPR